MTEVNSNRKLGHVQVVPIYIRTSICEKPDTTHWQTSRMKLPCVAHPGSPTNATLLAHKMNVHVAACLMQCPCYSGRLAYYHLAMQLFLSARKSSNGIF